MFTISQGDYTICKAFTIDGALEKIKEELENLRPGDEVDWHIWREE